MKTNKTILIVIGVIVVLVVAGIVVGQRIDRDDAYSAPSLTSSSTSAAHETLNPNAGSVTATSSASTTTTQKGYTLAQVATHNSVSSCWSTVNGKVYDLTSWIGRHPGGQQAILSICGKDGSAAFNDQHSGQRRPANELAGFLIGSLIK